MPGLGVALGAEEPLIDRAALAALREALGDGVLAELLSDGAFETTERLERLKRLDPARDLDEMRRIAHDLKGMTGQIGMPLVSKLAGELDALCVLGDIPAAAALAARLHRVATRSLEQLHLVRRPR